MYKIKYHHHDYDLFDLTYRCLICGKTLTAGWYYCKDHAIAFGIADPTGKFLRPLEWEDWARDYYNYARRERRKRKKIIERWVDFEHDEEIPSWKNKVVDIDDDNDKK